MGAIEFLLTDGLTPMKRAFPLSLCLLFAPAALRAEEAVPLEHGVYVDAKGGCQKPGTYADYDAMIDFDGKTFGSSSVVYKIGGAAKSDAGYSVKVHVVPTGGIGYGGKEKDIVWRIAVTDAGRFTLADPDPDGGRSGSYVWCAASMDAVMNSAAQANAPAALAEATPAAPATQNTSVLGPRYDALHGVYDGEQGDAFDHNGSWVYIFRHAGLIVYDKPKPVIADVVKKGDILFRGKIGKSQVAGTAYVFKSGCAPEPYEVHGGGLADKLDARLVLRGAAPVRAKGGCAVVGHSTTSGNATLAFQGQGEFGDF
jgi:hypothetical protein